MQKYPANNACFRENHADERPFSIATHLAAKGHYSKAMMSAGIAPFIWLL